MAEFKFSVIETRAVQMIYTVEAETEEEARELAGRGETVEESFVRDLSVNDRLVEEEIK
jgi:hypothetical protein